MKIAKTTYIRKLYEFTFILDNNYFYFVKKLSFDYGRTTKIIKKNLSMGVNLKLTTRHVEFNRDLNSILRPYATPIYCY